MSKDKPKMLKNAVNKDGFEVEVDHELYEGENNYRIVFKSLDDAIKFSTYITDQLKILSAKNQPKKILITDVEDQTSSFQAPFHLVRDDGSVVSIPEEGFEAQSIFMIFTDKNLDSYLSQQEELLQEKLLINDVFMPMDKFPIGKEDLKNAQKYALAPGKLELKPKNKEKDLSDPDYVREFLYSPHASEKYDALNKTGSQIGMLSSVGGKVSKKDIDPSIKDEKQKDIKERSRRLSVIGKGSVSEQNIQEPVKSEQSLKYKASEYTKKITDKVRGNNTEVNMAETKESVKTILKDAVVEKLQQQGQDKDKSNFK